MHLLILLIIILLRLFNDVNIITLLREIQDYMFKAD